MLTFINIDFFALHFYNKFLHWCKFVLFISVLNINDVTFIYVVTMWRLYCQFWRFLWTQLLSRNTVQSKLGYFSTLVTAPGFKVRLKDYRYKFWLLINYWNPCWKIISPSSDFTLLLNIIAILFQHTRDSLNPTRSFFHLLQPLQVCNDNNYSTLSTTWIYLQASKKF